MERHLASSKALGFGVLAVALWMFYVTHSGLVSPMAIGANVMHTVTLLAAIGLLVAGIVAFLRREGWLAFFFLLWAGLAWGNVNGMGIAAQGQGSMGGQDPATLFDAWFAIAITLVNLYLWLATLAHRGQHHGGAVMIMVLLLWVSWLLMALGGFLDVWILDRVGGVVGLASALVAFYVSAGTLARDSCPDMWLPCIAKAGDAGKAAGEGSHQGEHL